MFPSIYDSIDKCIAIRILDTLLVIDRYVQVNVFSLLQSQPYENFNLILVLTSIMLSPV